MHESICSVETLSVSRPFSSSPSVLSLPLLSLLLSIPFSLSFLLEGQGFFGWFSEKQFGPSKGQRQVKFCFDDSKWSDYPNERQLSKPHPSLCLSIAQGLFLFRPMLALHHIWLFIIFTTWFHLYSHFSFTLISHNALLHSSSQPFIRLPLTFSFIWPHLYILYAPSLVIAHSSFLRLSAFLLSLLIPTASLFTSSSGSH